MSEKGPYEVVAVREKHSTGDAHRSMAVTSNRPLMIAPDFLPAAHQEAQTTPAKHHDTKA